MEVINRFKGLDLIDRVPEVTWTEVPDIVQEAVIKTILKKKEMQKGKMVVLGGLTNSEKKEAKGKGEKEDISICMQSSKEWQGEIKSLPQ